MMKWTVSKDESNLLKSIKSYYYELMNSPNNVPYIDGAYISLKKIIMGDFFKLNNEIKKISEINKNTSIYNEAQLHEKKDASNYYQHINLNTLYRLWQASSSAHSMNEIIKGEKDAGWEAQLLGLYFLSFYSCSYSLIGLIHRECNICSDKRNQVNNKKDFLNLKYVNEKIPSLSKIIRQIIEGTCCLPLENNKNNIPLMIELNFYRNEGEHHFVPSSTLFSSDATGNKWMIPIVPSSTEFFPDTAGDKWINSKNKSNKIPYTIPFKEIIPNRDEYYQNYPEKFQELRTFLVKIFEWEVDLVNKVWNHLDAILGNDVTDQI